MVKAAVKRLVFGLMSLAPARLIRKFVVIVAHLKAKSLPPAEGLRFVFGLDNALYGLEGELSVAYGGGLHTKHFHTQYHDFFISHIEPDQRVLDIGCGIGMVAFDIADKAQADVWAIDLSEANIQIARNRFQHERVRYFVGDALEILPEGTYDVVVLSNVLEHLPDRSEFLVRVRTVTNTSKVLLRVPLLERDWRVPLKRELGVEWRLDPTHETEYTQESFAAEIDVAGLRIEEKEIRWGEIWAVCVPDART